MKTETFGERLKRIRRDRKITQEKLASLTEIAVQTIRNYEQNISEPISLYLLKLAQILDVTPEFLLLGDNNMNQYSSAIKAELMQIKDYETISEIKNEDFNATILSHLELSEDLVSDIKDDWNGKGIFKRNKSESGDMTEEDSYCTRNYVQMVIIKYCQNRKKFKEKFDLKDGMISISEKESFS